MTRKKDSITVSPKYGINPSLLKCPLCGKHTGIALLGKLKGDIEAPRETTGGLCDECRAKYVTCIVVKDEKSAADTGKRIFLPREAVTEKLRDREYLLITEETLGQLNSVNNGPDRQNT